jgi:hypothetical protein
VKDQFLCSPEAATRDWLATTHSDMLQQLLELLSSTLRSVANAIPAAVIASVISSSIAYIVARRTRGDARIRHSFDEFMKLYDSREWEAARSPSSVDLLIKCGACELGQREFNELKRRIQDRTEKDPMGVNFRSDREELSFLRYCRSGAISIDRPARLVMAKETFFRRYWWRRASWLPKFIRGK